MDKFSILELKEGSETAFKQLVESYKNKVINTCFGFVHNRTDADDLAQMVFIEVFESIHKFKEDSQLSTWIYRIAVNKSLDFIRKSNRKKRWSQLTRISFDNNENAENLFIHADTPDIALEQKQRIDILNKAINKLPENQKIAFTMHKYEDLSYIEIAEIMNTTVSSVESLMHRAKVNLKASLNHYYLSEK